jgi:DNA-binding MarR family transcriptional regulator
MGLEEDIKQGKKFENEYEKLLVNVMYTNSWLIEQQAKIFKPFSLTVPQYNVLRILRGAYPEPCTINSLIERMLDRMSNASRIVDRLEAKYFVERRTCEADRRAKDVLITQKGLNILEEVDQQMYDWLRSFDDIEIEQVENANGVLDAIRESE